MLFILVCLAVVKWIMRNSGIPGDDAPETITMAAAERMRDSDLALGSFESCQGSRADPL